MTSLTDHILATIESFRAQGERIKGPRGENASRMSFPDPVKGYIFHVDIPDLDFLQPPVVLERAHQLSGISQKYTLPGITSDQLQTYAMLMMRRRDIPDEQRATAMLRVWKRLKEDNPILAAIHGDAHDLGVSYDLVMGVASAFNTDDIQHFLIAVQQWQAGQAPLPPATQMEESREFAALTKVFNQCAAKKAVRKPLTLYWVASPKTLQKIENIFAERLAAPLKKDNPPAA